MKHFAQLFRRLDETNKTNRKVAALVDYFRVAQPADAAWALYFLTGNRPKRLLKARDLVNWCCREAGISDWLFGECYEHVGDLAETMALLLPDAASDTDHPLSEWVLKLLSLRNLNEDEQHEAMADAWRQLSRQERFVWNKLITGELRIGASKQLVLRALSHHLGVPIDVLAHRLMGTWEPTAEFYLSLSNPESSDADASRPYPFCLANPLQEDPSVLGDITNWLVEWKWDGIRAQIICRAGAIAIWSRGEELITERFPDLHPAADQLSSGTVLDGEIVAWRDDRVLPFAVMQRRIGRKQLGKKILADVPARFIAFDVLEWHGNDIRDQPLAVRREKLEAMLGSGLERIVPAPPMKFASWDECAEQRQFSREHGVEGFMLKRLDSPYAVGRPTGLWWKWKIDPYTIDAVLIYAQRGHGRRAALYTDYTFGLWDDGVLVPFAKAYSGLTDEEIREVDHFVRQNTLERFGPVRSVQPELVFELAFENIQRSTRHKSGIAVRFPRIGRWRKDKQPEDADKLETLRRLIPQAPDRP
jgi:DNA ligase-1